MTGEHPASRGPVVLVHGAGVRANIFRAPVRTTIVDYLIDRGYDVWLENWRASIDFAPNKWTLDQAAVFDHPEAIKTVVRETGATDVKAIIHCQGSTSFMMSAIAGLVPQVKTIVSNAVSLHTVVPKDGEGKLKYGDADDQPGYRLPESPVGPACPDASREARADAREHDAP